MIPVWASVGEGGFVDGEWNQHCPGWDGMGNGETGMGWGLGWDWDGMRIRTGVRNGAGMGLNKE